MLKGITWAEYFAVVALLTGAYYLFIGIRYYRTELKQHVSDKLNKLKQISSRKPVQPAAADEPDLATVLQDTQFPEEIDAFLNQLKTQVSLAAAHEYNKAELKDMLRSLISEFADLGQLSLKGSLNELIITECEQRCSVRLSAVELDQIWEEV